MSSESELDRVFGPPEFRLRQMYWRVMPLFKELEILEGKRPVVKEGEVAVSPDRRKRFRINISSIEKIIPFIAYKEGLIPELQPMDKGPKNEEAIIYGKLLHEADALFNLISQGHTGEITDIGLPTYTDQELEPYQRATDGIVLDEGAGKDQILDAFLTAWDRFFRPPDTTYNLSLEGLGVTDPRDLKRIRTSDTSYELGRKLAVLWAEQASDRRNRMWEFRQSAFTEREVSVTFIPADVNLVISTKFDFISRLTNRGGKVTTQIGDLKTGKFWEHQDLYGEVLRVQAQLMLLMAEKYTVEGLDQRVNLEKRGRDYILRNSSFWNLTTVGRSMFVYRIFSRETGELQRISVLTSREDREAFMEWMKKLLQKMYTYEAEVRSLINSNIEFRLAGVQMRKPLFSRE